MDIVVDIEGTRYIKVESGADAEELGAEGVGIGRIVGAGSLYAGGAWSN
jgi:hypothetical protein